MVGLVGRHLCSAVLACSRQQEQRRVLQTDRRLLQQEVQVQVQERVRVLVLPLELLLSMVVVDVLVAV